MQRRLTFLVLSLCLAVPPSSRSGDPKGDLAALQGKWKATTGPNKDITAILEVDGEKSVARLIQKDHELVAIRGKLKIDEAADPKTFDFHEDGKKSAGYLAIYKLDGDTLTVCTGTPKIGRPKKFEEGKDGWPALKVYERVSNK